MVDWVSLEAADGSAHDGPHVLAGLASEDASTHEEAKRLFWKRYWSRERWFSAQPAFVRALLANAFEVGAGGARRADALLCAIEIVTRGTGDKVMGVDLLGPSYSGGIGAELVEALRSRVGDAVRALSDSDERVRAAAASLLMAWGAGTESIVGALAARITAEPCEPVRATVAHVLGVLQRKTEGAARALANDALVAAQGDASLLVRSFALTGALASRRSPPSPDERSLLVAAMLLEADPRIPWKAGLVDEVIMELVHEVGGKDGLVESMIEALELASAKGVHGRVDEWSQQTVLHVFGGRCVFRRPSTLSPRERDVARRLVRCSGSESSLRLVGLPTKPSVLDAWLEVGGARALGTVVRTVDGEREVEETLWWALVNAANDGGDDVGRLQRSVPPAVLLEATAEYMLLEKNGDFTDQDLGLEPLAAAIDALGAGARPWAERTLERLRAAGKKHSPFASMCFLAASLGMTSNETWKDSWNLLINPSVIDDAIYERAYAAIRAHWPSAQREPVFLSVLARRSPFSARRLAPRLGDCPSPAVVEALLASVDEDECDEAGEVVAAIRTCAAADAHLASALSAYAAQSTTLKALLTSSPLPREA